MKTPRWMPFILGLALVFAMAATAADAPVLKFTFTKANVPGAQQTLPAGINNAGVSVGYYKDSGGTWHGYMLNGKKVTNLDDPNAIAQATSPYGLNLDGAISVVGAYASVKRNNPLVGFLYKGGKYTDIAGPKEAVQTVATGINDSGAIVGFYQDSAYAWHGFLLKGKKYTTLDVPGASNSFATGINKGGNIVLHWVDSSGTDESSLYNGQTYTTINVPGAAGSDAMGLNAAGGVCYEWADSSGVLHSALLHSGKYYKFDYPKSAASYGSGVNDKGNIIGDYQTASGKWFGFKATYK